MKQFMNFYNHWIGKTNHINPALYLVLQKGGKIYDTK